MGSARGMSRGVEGQSYPARRWTAAIACAIAFIAAGPCGLAADAFPGVRWLINREYVDTLLKMDPELIKARFDIPLTNIEGNNAAQLPAGWHSKAQKNYTSFATFERGIAVHAISPESVSIVLYDNERWPKTPREEKENPCVYMARFVALAHANGFRTNMAPDQNLGSPLVGTNRYQGGETRNWQSYLRMGLATCAANRPQRGRIWPLHSSSRSI
jgi:hypothetical protein